jgi:(p)ppGpp synthase/HD superfamily hydrolase
MIRIVDKAKQFSQKAHKGQYRKAGKLPYFSHPRAVYLIAKGITKDPDILAACYLHDTIEDTPTTYEDLLKEFNKDIADIVLAVSEDKTIEDWYSRKARYLKNVFANEKAIIVAWADKMHNSSDLSKIKDQSVFNVPIKDKRKFYKDFADLLPQKDLATRLNDLLDNIY